MDEDGKFWICVWSVLGMAILGIVISSLIYFNNVNKMISAAIKDGANPIEVRYAFGQCTANSVLILKSDATIEGKK